MAVKRVIDVIGAAVGLVLFSPVFLALAVAIVIDSGRPVLFRQIRLARGMREFRVLKFRTMKVGASSDMHRDYIKKLATGQADQDSLKKLTGDPRVTRVGRFLRKTSLDELPQLVNVLARKHVARRTPARRSSTSSSTTRRATSSGSR